MFKKGIAILLMTTLLTGAACSAAAAEAGMDTPGTAAEEDSDAPATAAEAEITIFAAKSLGAVMEDLIEAYTKASPGVTILGNYDSSGTLMLQIEEGASCDIFFSAAQKQMDELEEKGFLEADTRRDVVNNQVCVVTFDGSGTEVTGLSDLGKARSLALADGSVPVGKYTREALVRSGILPETKDVSAITAAQISEALGGVEINECANVGAVAAAVSEGSNEVGTVYYSDTWGYEEKLEILETVSYDLTGNVIYPAAQVINPEADEARKAAAADFLDYLTSDEAKAIFEDYHFDTNV